MIIIGPPTSGKTTLGQFLSDKYKDLRYTSLGEITRGVKKNTSLGRRIADLHQKAIPWPADFVIEILMPHILECHKKRRSFILDGAPRKMDELELLLPFLEDNQIDIQYIIHLYTSEDVFFDRLDLDNSGRKKRPENIIHYKKRFNTYNKNVKSMLTILKSRFNAYYWYRDTSLLQPASLTKEFDEYYALRESI